MTLPLSRCAAPGPRRDDPRPPGRRSLPLAGGSRTATQTKAWLAAQEELYARYLATVPGREKLTERLGELLGGRRGRSAGPGAATGSSSPGVRQARSTPCCTRSRPPAPNAPSSTRPCIDPTGVDDPRRLAARPRGAAAGLPAVRGRPGGVRAARHGHQHRPGRGWSDRPVPVLRRRLAAGRHGVLLHPQARPGRRAGRRGAVPLPGLPAPGRQPGQRGRPHLRRRAGEDELLRRGREP